MVLFVQSDQCRSEAARTSLTERKKLDYARIRVNLPSGDRKDIALRDGIRCP